MSAQEVWDAYGLGRAVPAYATLRDPSRPTIGPRIGRTARLLGQALMPWQQYVADTAGELNDDGTFRYQTVIVSIPRQGGKTTLVRAVGLDRAISRPRSRVYYTAQTRYDAVDNWREMAEHLVGRLRGTPLEGAVRAKIGTGNERLLLPNGSVFQPFAPTVASLHGKTSPLVIVDECFSFDAAAGEDLDGAIVPTHATVPDAQDWYISTFGDARSVWWHSKVDAAVEAVGPGSTVAVFVWSADPSLAAADPYGADTLAFHPALGHTQTTASLAAAAQKVTEGTWRRAFLNLRTRSTEAVLDLEAWDRAATATAPPPTPSRVPVAYDVAADRSCATLVAGWTVPGSPGACTGLVATGPGYRWAVERARQLGRAGHPLVADDSGPTRTLTAALRAAGARVRATTPREYSTACQRLVDDACAGVLLHDGEAVYRDQIEAAVMRPMGGATGLDPARSTGPIDALRALALASWAAQDLALTPAVQVF